jgi:protein-disulfide isomerase
LPFFRRTGGRAAKPDSRATSADSNSRSGAGRGSTGSFPVMRVTMAAVALGGVLVVLLVVLNRGQGSSAEATPSTTTSTGATTPTAPIAVPLVHSPIDLAHGRSLGSADAPVQLDLWADFQCPACDAFAGSVAPELVKRYIRPGKARLTFHDMAYLGNESLGAAISARCAERQGKFWEYHDLLFANQAPENSGAFTKERSRQFASKLDLDLDAFTACFEDTSIEDGVLAEAKQGIDQGITETPTLYVNGKIVRPANSWDPISAAINAALKTDSGSSNP